MKNNKDSKFQLNWLKYPEYVNVYTIRVVATLVSILSIVYLFTENSIVLVFISYGFWARVIAGQIFSPLTLLSSKVIIPILGNPKSMENSRPKRFAQTIGGILSTISLVLAISGLIEVSKIIILVLLLFASLESIFGFCAGCWIYKHLQQFNVISKEICYECKDYDNRTKLR
ncbi:MAG: DUF4395 domain-containing protein [Candidatus Marinimicrobia bacterium]|nr:DUF4395 domain-containing protein [Candidatus Neomarinimicrobiota bacterium]MBL7023099.1 DUF4395 domain-containing protein [Candidatus Neomarinimicrobiota bacterium]MBL7109119.1 DUF4395 domain-containing protein [Candidatus Neomarinimicrobiota bacterium]